MGSLRICVADEHAILVESIEGQLTSLGHTVVGGATTAEGLVDHCTLQQPDLVVMSTALPGYPLETLTTNVLLQRVVPIICTSDEASIGQHCKHNCDYVMAHLVKPVRRCHLEGAIEVAMRQFTNLKRMESDVEAMRQALKDRKLIERAKGIIMETTGATEADAFRRLQKLSWDNNRKIVEMAEVIIMASEAISSSSFSRTSDKGNHRQSARSQKSAPPPKGSQQSASAPLSIHVNSRTVH